MISTKVIMTSLSLILVLNNFVHTTYKQWTVPWIQNVLLSYANIFLANFEAKHIYPYIMECLCYTLETLKIHLWYGKTQKPS